MTAKKPLLVVGEGIVGPFMATCLRSKGLHCHLWQPERQKRSIDYGSIVLMPDMTHYLTHTLGLSGARPPGNTLDNYYSYDHKANVLMNLNLDSLRPQDESGTFFTCQRSVVEKILLKECQKRARYLEHKNPIKVLERTQLTDLKRKSGALSAQFGDGMVQEYQAVINVSRDMDAVPLINKDHEPAVQHRKEIKRIYKRELAKAPVYYEWTFATPKDWGLEKDEMAEIIHPGKKRLWIRATAAKELTLVTSVGKNLKFAEDRLAQYSGSVLKYWEDPKDVTVHALWKEHLMPAFEEFGSKNDGRKLDYLCPNYNFENWLEEDGDIIRMGPAAHGDNAEPIDVADAIDFEDCFALSEVLAQNPTAEELASFIESRRKEVVDEKNFIGLIDEDSFKSRNRLLRGFHKTWTTWTKAHSRNWKRAVRTFCAREV